MLLTIGKRYYFMTQRYAWSGTVVQITPTHVMLGDDAEWHPENSGGEFGDIAVGKVGKGQPVPGQVVCMLGTDATPIGHAKKSRP